MRMSCLLNGAYQNSGIKRITVCLLLVGATLLRINALGQSPAPSLIKEFPGAHLLKPNGGWCWCQGRRAIVTRDGKVVFTTISGDQYAGFDSGDLWATSWDPKTGAIEHSELHDRFQRVRGFAVAKRWNPSGCLWKTWKRYPAAIPNDVGSWKHLQMVRGKVV